MRIAVTGAAGQMGRKVVSTLSADSPHEVVAVTRAVADYSEPQALRKAFEDAETLVFVSSDGPAANVVLHHQNVVRAAEGAGIGHVVALSSVDADLASPFCYAVTNGRTEQLLRDGGLRYSIVRASIYSEFFADAFITRALATGQLRLPAGDGRISLVSRDDVADVLAMLAVGEPTGRHHNITGSRALDGHGIASAASRQRGTSITYVDITPDEFALDMAAEQVDPWWAYTFSSMFASVREGRWDVVTDDFESLTGRAP